MDKVQNYCKVSVDELQAYMDTLERDGEGTPGTSVHRRQLCESLGLENQAGYHEPKQAVRYYPMLNEYQARIWLTFLPTSYSRKKGGWKSYRFDVIPTEMLELVSRADSLDLFDDFEIWTPESQRHHDPMVVGVIGKPTIASRLARAEHLGALFFPVARWSESLQSFEEIEKKVLMDNIDFRSPIEQLHANTRYHILALRRRMVMEGRGLVHMRFCGYSQYVRHCGANTQNFIYDHFDHNYYRDVYVCCNCNFSREEVEKYKVTN